MDIMEKISRIGLVPVVKVNDPEDALPLCRALAGGGLPIAEITFRTDAAEEAIRRVKTQLTDVLLGAGTVISVEQARQAIGAGASFIVSPGINPEVVRFCQKAGVPVIPGCASPSDIGTAVSLGLTTVKFFPSEALGGLKMIKAMSAPYRNVYFMPNGGITEQNLTDYLAFDRVVACGGGFMAPSDAITMKDWRRVEELTRGAVRRILGLELLGIGLNSGSVPRAEKDAFSLCALLGWTAKEQAESIRVGDSFELMKGPARGKIGHITLGCHGILRAKWHLGNRGFVFDEHSAETEDGHLLSIYLRNEIAGYAIRLVEKRAPEALRSTDGDEMA